MHAVDRLARAHVLVQRLQHQAVAAERDDDVGLGGIAIAVERVQLRQRRLRLGAALATKAIRSYRLGVLMDDWLVG